MKKFYITIGRQLGAGGLTIAKELSKQLQIPMYDKELLDIAAKESGIAPEFFNNADEKPQGYLNTHSFFGLTFSAIMNEFSTYSPLDTSELFRIQGQAIREIAEKQSAIFVGRCADYVLREKNCLNVFISCSSNEERIKHLRERKSIKNIDELTDKEILSLMEKGDKKRAQYYNYFTYKEWGKAESYHLTIDSSYFGIEGTINIILNALKENKII